MSWHDKETEPVKVCGSCSAQLPASDKFCRRCGVDQLVAQCHDLTDTETDTAPVSGARPNRAGYLLSSTLVGTITESVAIKPATLRPGRLGIRLVAGLIVIPIWLLIVLLSPVDAFLSAKAASNQISIR